MGKARRQVQCWEERGKGQKRVLKEMRFVIDEIVAVDEGGIVGNSRGEGSLQLIRR